METLSWIELSKVAKIHKESDAPENVDGTYELAFRRGVEWVINKINNEIREQERSNRDSR